MNIGELKKLIEGKPDSIEILVPGSDHSYTKARCRITTALKERSCLWTEDYGEEITPAADGNRVTVLIVE